MFAYFARQPIFTPDREVYAYEILFRDGENNCFPDIPPDEATSKLLAETHLIQGLEEITGDKLAFINFHRDTLMYRFPTFLDANRVVLEIVETVKVDSALVNACKHLRGLGYKIGLDDYDKEKHWDAFLPFTSFIKVDVKEHSREVIKSILANLKATGVRFVAEKVETYEEFQYFKSLGFDLFQGYFLARPEVVRHRRLSTSKTNMLDLLIASSSFRLDFEKINQIIERDVSLTYLLLRFINNPMFNKRHKISSLRHALTYMGEVEVKKFIALLALANLSEGQPSELMHMSLVRAKFCELMSLALNEKENPPTGFLTGLLSMLDAIMEQQMSELMEKIPIADEVRAALCGQQNLLRDCLVLVQWFEQGNWAGVKKMSIKHGIRQQLLHAFYNEAIKWSVAISMSTQPE